MKAKIAGILRDSGIAINKIGMRERSSNIAMTSNLSSVEKIKDFTAADKDKVREILANNLAEGKGMRGTANDLKKQFPDMDPKRAEKIARTGHTEVRNLAHQEDKKEKGFNSFTVDFTSDACEDCVATYENMVFSIDDEDMLPPLHPHCMCVAVYHEETPEEFAALEGYDIYGDGSDFEEVTEETEQPESLDELIDVDTELETAIEEYSDDNVERYTEPNEGNTAKDIELQEKAQDMLDNYFEYSVKDNADMINELSNNPTFDNLAKIVQLKNESGFPEVERAYREAVDRVIRDPRTRKIDLIVLLKFKTW